MADWKLFSKVHQFVYRISKGRVGARLAGIDMVVIHCIGRKSGLGRPTPIACYPYGNNVAVVASNNGADKDPVWWLNLKAHPEVDVQLGKRNFPGGGRGNRRPGAGRSLAGNCSAESRRSSVIRIIPAGYCL